MKTLMALLLITTSAVTLANETTILTETLSKRAKEISLYRTQYRFNADMGRAWLKLEIQFDDSNGHADEWSYIEKRVRVPGMSYDNNTGSIMYNGVVCATTKQGRVFTNIYPTGNCMTKLYVDTIQVDDGFNMVTKKKVDVVLSNY